MTLLDFTTLMHETAKHTKAVGRIPADPHKTLNEIGQGLDAFHRAAIQRDAVEAATPMLASITAVALLCHQLTLDCELDSIDLQAAALSKN